MYKIGQQEVCEWLKEEYKDKDKWFNSHQIAKGVKQSIGSTINNLKRLRESHMIAFKPSNKSPLGYEYQYMPNAKYEKIYW